MNLIATHLAKRFLKRELIAEESLEWCIYGIEKRLSMFTTWTLLILLGSYCFGFRRTISFAVCFVTSAYVPAHLRQHSVVQSQYRRGDSSRRSRTRTAQYYPCNLHAGL